MKRRDRTIQEPFWSQSALHVFGLCRAPIFPPAASVASPKVVQDQNKGEHLAKSPKSLVHALHQARLSAQDTIKKLTCENVTLREESARLMSLLTEAMTEKEEMEARIGKMEEDFQKEKKAWQDLSRQQLGEISRFRMELLVAQSHSHQMEEELRESKRELYEGRRQMVRGITSLEESFCIQSQENTAKLSAMEDYWREVMKVRQENAATKLRESEERWQRRVNQLEEEMKEQKSSVSSLVDKMMAVTGDLRNILTLLSRKWECKCEALEESYRKEITEKEKSWQRRVQEMEKQNELEKMWLQKEEEWRQKTSSLEEDIKRLLKENTQLQLTGKKKRKQWWKRRFRLRRLRQRDTTETALLLPQSKEK